MKILRYFIALTKAITKSPTAWIFFCLHLIILIIALIQRGTIQPIHFEYEFLLYKIIIFLNIPASLVVYILFLPILILFSVFNLENSSIAINSLIIFGYVGWQIQSAVIGYGVEKLINRWRKLK